MNTALASPWRGVFFDGPQSDQNHDGDDHDPRSGFKTSGTHLVAGLGSQIPMWVVYIGDEDANPIGTVYTVGSYAYAATLARSMARERNLELVDEAMPD